MKLQLVENWKQCWRWISVHCMFVSGLVQAAWLELPADLKAYLPEWVGPALAIGLLVLGVIGRLIKQGSAE